MRVDSKDPEFLLLVDGVLDGNTPIGVLADFLEERGDNRHKKVRDATTRVDVSFLLLDWPDALLRGFMGAVKSLSSDWSSDHIAPALEVLKSVLMSHAGLVMWGGNPGVHGGASRTVRRYECSRRRRSRSNVAD